MVRTVCSRSSMGIYACKCSQNNYNRSDNENIYYGQQPIHFIFSPYRRQVLALLLLRPDERFHVRELERLTGISAGSLHRELKAMAEAGLLIREHQGNQVLYQADRSCSIFEELASIFRKTVGLGFNNVLQRWSQSLTELTSLLCLDQWLQASNTPRAIWISACWARWNCSMWLKPWVRCKKVCAEKRSILW